MFVSLLFIYFVFEMAKQMNMKELALTEQYEYYVGHGQELLKKYNGTYLIILMNYLMKPSICRIISSFVLCIFNKIRMPAKPPITMPTLTPITIDLNSFMSICILSS